MMMTCRLLCALLVLALCCCPSVCVSEEAATTSPDDHDDDHNKTTYYDHDNHDKTTNHDHHHTTQHQATHYNTGTKHYDYRGASCVDHPRTVTSSRNRRQPQQLCVGVCPAGARCIRAGVHRSGLKRCVRAVRASTQPRVFVRVCCCPIY
ncbi:mucin TcMUCII [Trypanosoma cruzi cruzi]|nr:mucin TcMUCII [Trypanosoma cruzi cruzi]